MARGDTDGGNKLASITDKIRRGVIADTQIATALSNAVAYESRNLDESSFETDGEYRWAVGHADGLSDALAIARGENWKEVIDYEVECDHKIEWGDDDERGYCVVCGKECDWHYENQVVNEGHDEDGRYTCQTANVRVPHEWHEGDGGIIKQYIDEQKRKYAGK